MKVIVSDFDGTLYSNNQIILQDRINQFIKEGNIFIIATGRNMTSLKKDLDKFGMEANYYICNDGALILDQYLNVIYRTDIDISMVRPLYNDLKNDDNILEVLIDTGNGYIDDVNRSCNKLIARYFDKNKAINTVNRLNSQYTSIFGYVSNNWINVTKKTETKGKAIDYLAKYYHFLNYPIHVIGNDINDISMCDYNFISYGLDDGNNLYLAKYDNIVNSFEEAFELIINS